MAGEGGGRRGGGGYQGKKRLALDNGERVLLIGKASTSRQLREGFISLYMRLLMYMVYFCVYLLHTRSGGWAQRQ